MFLPFECSAVIFVVVAVKFANDDKSRVACCSYDGTISVMQVIPTPATVICVLRDHTSAVTGQAKSVRMLNYVCITHDGACFRGQTTLVYHKII